MKHNTAWQSGRRQEAWRANRVYDDKMCTPKMGGLNFHTSRKTHPNDTTDAQGTGHVPSCPQETCSPAPASWELVESAASRPGRTQHQVKRGSCVVGNVCKVRSVFQPTEHGSRLDPGSQPLRAERPPPPEASSSTGASERIIFKVLEEGRVSTVFGLEKACGFCFKPLSCCNVRRVYIRGPTPTPGGAGLEGAQGVGRKPQPGAGAVREGGSRMGSAWGREASPSIPGKWLGARQPCPSLPGAKSL